MQIVRRHRRAFDQPSAYGPGCVKNLIFPIISRAIVGASAHLLFRCSLRRAYPFCVTTGVPEASQVGLMSPFFRVVECHLRLDCLKERFHLEYRQQPFEVVRQHMQTHLGAHMLERLHLEVGRAHPGFKVPNGCSMVCRRVRIRSGSCSRRAAAASRTASCSQRVTRR